MPMGELMVMRGDSSSIAMGGMSHEHAYASGPWQCARSDHDPREGCWAEEDAHRALIERLSEYDGWALSCGAKDLAWLLPLLPSSCRVPATARARASWKPGAYPACEVSRSSCAARGSDDGSMAMT